MNQQEIENTILRNLYEEYFSGDGHLNSMELCNKEGWDANDYSKVERRLRKDELIFAHSISTHRITSKGIVYCEERGIAQCEINARNNEARRLVLDYLNKVSEEGPSEEVFYMELVEKTGLDQDMMMKNLEVLVDLHYVDAGLLSYYKIADRGINAIQDWTNKNSIAREFKAISKMNPQMRGREFQKLFATIIGQFGWLQEEAVRTSHEEMDVIIYRDREYYVVECKWENEPIGAAVIRELYGKLSNRADVRGIVVSISGFTEGASTQVKEHVSSRVILLFGSKDVNSLIYEKGIFDDLLNHKYKELITRKKVVWD